MLDEELHTSYLKQLHLPKDMDNLFESDAKEFQKMMARRQTLFSFSLHFAPILSKLSVDKMPVASSRGRELKPPWWACTGPMSRFVTHAGIDPLCPPRPCICQHGSRACAEIEPGEVIRSSLCRIFCRTQTSLNARITRTKLPNQTWKSIFVFGYTGAN